MSDQNTRKRPVAFFVQGGAHAGLGHFERCKLIAQEATRRGREIVIFLHGPNDLLTARNWPESVAVQVLAEAPINADTMRSAVEFSKATDAGIIIVDGYDLLAANLPQRLQGNGKVLAITDTDEMTRNTVADVILNQNLCKDTSSWISRLKPQVLAGLEFTLVSPELSPEPSYENELSRILITFGGADPTRSTRSAIRMVVTHCQHPVTLDVVIGPYFRHRPALENAHHRLNLHQSPDDLTALLCQADIVVSAAGSTCLQACRLGRPLIAITVADNQENLACALSDAQAALVISRAQLSDGMPIQITHSLVELFTSCEAREQTGRRGAALIDGYGVNRVADAISI